MNAGQIGAVLRETSNNVLRAVVMCVELYLSRAVEDDVVVCERGVLAREANKGGMGGARALNLFQFGLEPMHVLFKELHAVHQSCTRSNVSKVRFLLEKWCSDVPPLGPRPNSWHASSKVISSETSTMGIYGT